MGGVGSTSVISSFSAYKEISENPFLTYSDTVTSRCTAACSYLPEFSMSGGEQG